MSDVNTNGVPALSIRQPWAELIINGQKTIEIRQWSTEYRGLLWIHVGGKCDPYTEVAFGMSDLFRGGYLGRVVLRAVLPLDPERWEAWRGRHLDRADYRPGLYGWLLSYPERFAQPISGPGRLSLFYPPLEQQTVLRGANLIAPRRELARAASS